MKTQSNRTSSTNILFIAAEADPWIKVGGLGDVAGSLPQAVVDVTKTKRGKNRLDVRLAIPYYPAIKSQLKDIPQTGEVTIPTKNGAEKAEIYTTRSNDVPVYLIDGEPVRNSEKVYSSDMSLDGRKFTFFSLAALELPRLLNWSMHILHANDWHTSPAIYAFAQAREKDITISASRSILTIHNLPFMGAGSSPAMDEFHLPPLQEARLPGWARHMPLPLGLATADYLVAVSPTYAREILTPAYGCSLEDFLSTRKDRIAGILNGIDTNAWNPATDSAIHETYALPSLDVRVHNKAALQAEFQLEQNYKVPLLILISRLDQQKGVDIALNALRELGDIPWQAIILGTGDPVLEATASQLQADYQDRVRLALRFDSALSHRLYSGGDMILMPSRYEPCGLAQMIAMRYGCVPVVSATGGLVDTVIDSVSSRDGTGFICRELTPVGFARTILSAVTVYQKKARWKEVQANGMQMDFSWKHSAQSYADLYRKLLTATV